MTRFTLFRRVIFAAALVPAAALVYGAFTNELTANPIDYITDVTGTTALTFLVLSLVVTPLRRLTGKNELIKLRRMLGLFAFFYACLHFVTWTTRGADFRLINLRKANDREKANYLRARASNG